MSSERYNLFSISLDFWKEMYSVIGDYRNEDNAVFAINEKGEARFAKTIKNEDDYETVCYLQLLSREDRADMSDEQIDALNLLLVYNFCIKAINEFEAKHPELEGN